MADSWDLPEPPTSRPAPAKGAPAPTKMGGRELIANSLVRQGGLAGGADLNVTTQQDFEHPSVEGAGFTIATLGSPYAKLVPYLGKLPMPIIRVLLGAAGSEVGAELEGKPVGVGAVHGAVAGTIGEGLGASVTLGKWAVSKGLEKVGIKSKVASAADTALAGAKGELADIIAGQDLTRTMVGRTAEQRAAYDAEQRAGQIVARDTTAGVVESTAASQAAQQQRQRATQMTADVGQVAGRASPPMGFQTPAQMEELARRPGATRAQLGKYWDESLGRVDAAIGADTQLRVPSLVDRQAIEADVIASIQMPRGQKPPAGLVKQLVDEEFAQQSMMTVREAAEKLKTFGLRGFTATGERRGAYNPREQRRVASQEIRDELAARSPEAAQAFEEGNRGFQVGLALLTTMKKEGLFNKSPEGTQLTIRELQGAVSRNRERLERAMTPSDWNALKEVVFKGGDLSTLDRPTKDIIKEAGTAARQRFEAGVTIPPAGPTPKEAGAAARSRLEMGMPRVPSLEELMQARKPTTQPFSPREMMQIIIDSGVERTLSGMTAPPTRKPLR